MAVVGKGAMYADVGETEALLAAAQFYTSPAIVSSLWMRPFLAPYLVMRVKQRFAAEGDDVSGKWAPLTERTQNIREFLGYPREHPINHRSGALYNFVSGEPGYSVSPQMASLYMPGDDPDSYMLKKFLGAQQGEGSAPPRPVLGLNIRDAMYATSSLAAFIEGSVRFHVPSASKLVPV